MTADVSSIIEYWRRELPRVEGFPAPMFADKIKETIAILEAMSAEPVAWRGKHMHPAATEWVYVDGAAQPVPKFGGLIQLQPLYDRPAVTLGRSVGAEAAKTDGAQEPLAGEALLSALAERLEQTEGESGMIAECDDCLAVAAAIRDQADELAKTKKMLAECFTIGVDYLTATKEAEADREAQAQILRDMTLLLLQTSRYAPDAEKDRVAGYVKRKGLSSPFRGQAAADVEGNEEAVQPIEAGDALLSDDVLIAAMLAIEEGEHQHGWFAKWRDSMDEWKGEHFGDCTKAPISCLRCAYDEAMKRLPEFKRVLADLVSEQPEAVRDALPNLDTAEAAKILLPVFLGKHEDWARSKGRNPLDYTSKWRQAADILDAFARGQAL